VKLIGTASDHLLDLEIEVRPGSHGSGIAIVLPAFLDSKDDSVVAELASLIPVTGLDTITFDPRGTWSNELRGSVADLAPSRQLADLRALINSKAAPQDRVVLVGHCYGGYLSLLAAGSDRRVTDVVALMPTRCLIWNKDYDARFDTWADDEYRTFLRKDAAGLVHEFAVPHSVVRDAARHSLSDVLPTLRQRVLLVGGTKDQVVGTKTVQQMHQECAPGRASLEILPVKHDFRDVPRQHDLVNRCVVNWLKS
jgi:pimeloyl-ACP methyl ester carboxylesterase